MTGYFGNLSIRRKQVLIIMLTSTVALMLACLAFVSCDVLNFRRELVERAGAVAEVIAEHSAASLDFSDPKTAEQTLSALGTDPDFVAGCIYDKAGRVFAIFERDHGQGFSPPPPGRSGYRFSNGRLHLFRPITEGGEEVGTIYVESDLRELPARVGKYAEVAGMVFGMSLLAALVISSRLQRVVSGPILHLAQLARTVAEEKNYSVRAEKRSRDELGQLIDGFNEMLEQIQQRDDALRAGRDNLEQRVKDRTNELARSLSLLNATLNATGDGIVAVDLSGKVLCYNEKFAAMWRIPASMLNKGNRDEIVSYCAQQCENGEKYLARTRETLGRPEECSLDVFTLVDGRVVERLSHPQFMEGKCIGTVRTFRDVTERKKAEANLQKANAELVQASRLAGMAEVATNVLHNVGNVLNSVNTSASVVMDQVRGSKVKSVSLLAELLERHKDDLATFLTSDRRGKQVVDYLKSLSGLLADEQASVVGELSSLTKNIEHIKQIVSMQQSYAKASGVEEIHSPVTLVEDALRIHAEGIMRHRVRVERDFERVPDIVADKHKVLQILINLIGNAKYALAETERDHRLLTLGIRPNGSDRIQIFVKDNGVGIPQENLIRIFSHGFTTKKNGHGFGLHSGFLAAKEMRGALSVQSDGRGRGAVFTLELPVNARSKS